MTIKVYVILHTNVYNTGYEVAARFINREKAVAYYEEACANNRWWGAKDIRLEVVEYNIEINDIEDYLNL